MSAEQLPFATDQPEIAALPSLESVITDIHDSAFQQYEALEYGYNRLSNDAVTQDTAFAETYRHAGDLLETPLLTQRIHEFMSSSWRGAPIYEASDDALADGSVIGDVHAAIELFGHTYDESYTRPDPYRKSEHIDTATGTLIYSTQVLASRAEIDPAAVPESAAMVLVGHFVHEPQTGAAFRYNYVLLEALRPPRLIDTAASK